MNTNTRVRDWYNKKASIHFEGRWSKSAAHRWDYTVTRRTLLEELNPSPNDRILEIGCGPGTWTDEVAANCRQLVALDIAASMIEQAKLSVEGANVQFVCSDFLDCELSGKFDKIFSVRAIEYIDGKEALARKISSLLAPEGKVVLITKNRLSLWRGRFRVLDLFDRLLRRKGRKSDVQVENTAPLKDMVSPGQIAKELAVYNLTTLRVRPVVIRPPIFRDGFREYPIIPKSLAEQLLKPFTLLFNACAKSPKFLRNLTLFLAESFCITLKGR